MRAGGTEPNRSTPPPCLARLTSVSVTVCAFLENMRASTMMTPALSR